jgi:lysine 2,3-aminomutase
MQELFDPPFLHDDPLEEEKDMPVPGLVHRYADRALLIATTTCSMYCRHCTRKRVAGMHESTISSRRLQQVVTYLTAHPEISDVIVSGGDPLTMATDALERVLAALRSVPSVQIIRIGTRTPVVLPQRITDELTSMLRKYHPVWINTHFNHPAELTPQAAEACGKLADAGIPLGNQSVLLKGINDDPRIIEELCRGLVRMRVRPYYLFQCDLVRGVEHFRTPLSRGLQIMEYLRGRLSGLAIPSFVVDAPHGGGKIPVLPTYVVSTSPTHTVLRNFEGMLVAYPEPGIDIPPASINSGATVSDLLHGRASAIQPSQSARQRRRKESQAKNRGLAQPVESAPSMAEEMAETRRQ